MLFVLSWLFGKVTADAIAVKEARKAKAAKVAKAAQDCAADAARAAQLRRDTEDIKEAEVAAMIDADTRIVALALAPALAPAIT